MRNYTLIIEHNDGRVLSWELDEECYVKMLYNMWEQHKVMFNVKSGQLLDNLTQSTICSFGM